MPAELRRDTVKLGDLLSVAEQIQAFSLAGKTGEIYITNVPPPARINLIAGEVVDAQFGLRTGLDAVIALINLPEALTEFIVGEKAQRRTIHLPYIEILCEAARVKDEAAAKAPPAETVQLSPSDPYLRVTLGSEIRAFAIHPGLTHIGRAISNDIVINHPTLSQQHATIEFSRSGFILRDLGSTNGTFVASRPVQECRLNVLDHLQFGSVSCLFVGGVTKGSPVT